MKVKIVSPCISICKTDPVTGYCYGCARTNEEKKLWKNDSTLNEWKLKNLEIISLRMKGWQLETFKESYQHKIECGISGVFLKGGRTWKIRFPKKFSVDWYHGCLKRTEWCRTLKFLGHVYPDPVCQFPKGGLKRP